MTEDPKAKLIESIGHLCYSMNTVDIVRALNNGTFVPYLDYPPLRLRCLFRTPFELIGQLRNLK